MSESESSTHRKSHKQHDNCQNCVREKKQNQALIKIYLRLQQVQKNAHRVNQAVQHHKLTSDTNRSFYKSFEQKIISLPKVKKQINSASIENAGFELAINILERDAKSKVIEENERLKKILSQMRKDKWEQQLNSPSKSMAASYFSEKKSNQNHFDQGFSSYHSVLPNRSFVKQLDSEQLLTTNGLSQSCNAQNSSTKSSSFNVRERNSVDMSRYGDLNLWLYQNQKHTQLQSELFVSKRVRGLNKVLPTIRVKK